MRTHIICAIFTFLFCFHLQAQQTEKERQDLSFSRNRLFQLSFIYPLSTNGHLASQITNQLSVNMIAGHSYGANGIELGGFYNLTRNNVNGVQLAGFGNATGGNVNGVQLAGFINTNKGYVSGLQMAGFSNVVVDSLKGTQLAGFVNIAKEVNGSQLSGFTSISAGNLNGTQLSGFYNRAKNVSGVQVGGFMNNAEDVDGFQVAGFLNTAKRLRGVQLGVINIADSVEQGAAIGLFNIVKKGKLEAAVEYNDFMDISFSFRSGTDRFYSVISAGMNPSRDLWAYGAGFGTQRSFAQKLLGSVEVSSHHIRNTQRKEDQLNLLNRLQVNVGCQLSDQFSIHGGPVLNIYITKAFNDSDSSYGDDFGQSTFFDETNGKTNVSMWIGYSVSLRFQK